MPYKRSSEETLLIHGLPYPLLNICLESSSKHHWAIHSFPPTNFNLPTPSQQRFFLGQLLGTFDPSQCPSCSLSPFPLTLPVYLEFLLHANTALGHLFLSRLPHIIKPFHFLPLQQFFSHLPIPLQQRFFLGPLLGTFNPFWCQSCNPSPFS
jgi:hypothetical protein